MGMATEDPKTSAIREGDTVCPECHVAPHRDDCARLARMPEGMRNAVRRGEELTRHGLRVYGDRLIDAKGRAISDEAAEEILRRAGIR